MSEKAFLKWQHLLCLKHKTKMTMRRVLGKGNIGCKGPEVEKTWCFLSITGGQDVPQRIPVGPAGNGVAQPVQRDPFVQSWEGFSVTCSKKTT